MAQESPVQWFVEEDNQRKGPFTLEQIQELFDQGKIQGKSRVSNGTQSDQQLNVQDIIKSRSDPLYTLIEALQAAREKKTKQEISTYEGSNIYNTPSSQPKNWVLLGLVTVLSIIVFWSMILVSRSPAPEESNKRPTISESTPSGTPQSEGIALEPNLQPSARPNQPEKRKFENLIKSRRVPAATLVTPSPLPSPTPSVEEGIPEDGLLPDPIEAENPDETDPNRLENPETDPPRTE